MASRIKGITVEISGDTTKLEQYLGETLDNRYTLETMKEILLSKCIFAGFNG